ncbi:hypothetical protein D6777_04330 [Candidatus Woesearchaeota archaeon]|nr:MAG: hypothetical protein D6777_04330 [Candidatus Woesearchaeota archaeon]
MLEKIDRNYFFLLSLNVLELEKLNLLLTYSGLKNGSLVRYSSKKIDFKGLHGRVRHYDLEHKILFLGKDDYWLEKLDNSFSKVIRLINIDNALRNDYWLKEYKKSTYELGVSLGYPVSAVEYFTNEYHEAIVKGGIDIVSSARKRVESLGKPLSYFMPYVPSEKYFKLEVSLAKEWQNFIKKNYPEAYFKILVDFIV